MVDPGLELLAGDAAFDREIAVDETECRGIAARQPGLHLTDGLVERVAHLVLDQSDQGPQALWMGTGGGHRLNIAQCAWRAHHRQAVPMGEGGEILRWHRQLLAHHGIYVALAEHWRDDMVDDAVIERVAGDTDAGVAQRGHQLRTVRGEAHDRKVAGAATKIADQHGGRRIQRAGDAIACGLRLQRNLDFGEASLGKGGT